MMTKKRKALKIIILFVIVLVATTFYIINYLAKGVGNSIEKGTKGVYEFSKSLDSTELKKVDSLKQEVIKKVDSSTAKFN